MLRCALRATLFVAVAAAATAATAAADADCEEVSMLVAKQVPGQEKNDPLRTETQNEVMLLSSNLQYQVVFTDTDANELSSFLEGCRQIFLDVGSNRGTHVRKLFEPQKYAGAPYLKVFERVFGPAWKRRTPSSGICAVGFEPNSEWIPHHQDIERTYAKQGWKVKFFPVAVSDHEGKLDFFHGTKGNSEVGFSAFRHNHSGQTVEVQMEPFSQFISRINTTVPSGIRLVKMDIEGSEFEVLPDLLQKRMLCQDTIPELTIEWHFRFFGEASQEKNQQIWKDVHLHKCFGSGLTLVQTIDDESFTDDGKPLP